MCHSTVSGSNSSKMEQTEAPGSDRTICFVMRTESIRSRSPLISGIFQYDLPQFLCSLLKLHYLTLLMLRYYVTCSIHYCIESLSFYIELGCHFGNQKFMNFYAATRRQCIYLVMSFKSWTDSIIKKRRPTLKRKGFLAYLNQRTVYRDNIFRPTF